jgi:hypothetical protein
VEVIDECTAGRARHACLVAAVRQVPNHLQDGPFVPAEAVVIDHERNSRRFFLDILMQNSTLESTTSRLSPTLALGGCDVNAGDEQVR